MLSIIQSRQLRKVSIYMDYMIKHNIDIISIYDKEYPQILKKIYDPPMCLYVKGNKDILNNLNIGVIGSRNCTENGSKIAKRISYELALRGINIVSGLARGIDVAAHIGALYAKKPTIAILGHGLDMIYPQEHINIAKKILEYGGTLVSEYPIGIGPEKYNFVARNRILSGICKGILVVEAKKKSGTNLTVDFALEQGRDIFAIPGEINNSNAEGTNELIKEGAKLVSSYKDILEEYNLHKF